MNLVWHRADLRLHDNPALGQALKEGPVLGLVVLDPNILQNTSPRRRAWFYQNVAALREGYARRGGVLLVRQGLPWEVLPQMVGALGVKQVYAVRNFTPYARFRDQKVGSVLPGRVNWLDGQYIHEPGAILKPEGGPYTVFTPFSKRWWAARKPVLLEAPPHLPAVSLPPGFDLGVIPEEASDVPLPPVGEEAALGALEVFLRDKLPRYHQTRDGLAGEGVSRLSYYFTLGVLSPRLAARRALQVGGEGALKWVNELCWRDFSGDLLYHRPEMLTQAFDPRWNDLPWNDDGELFSAWLHGQTGIPVVDACMRELRATGFLSNRGRMVVAQFAVKLALLPWQKCERAFRDLLLDGDNASNLQGWHWAGGLGVDAAPYFRVFNLVTQAETHDPGGAWLRRWVPESGGRPEPYKAQALDLDLARRRYLAAAGQIAKKPDWAARSREAKAKSP
ncbi:MAG: deoxyribodipyrimidine photo-lyase [Meiothermus sp.]|uniref:cryptochrome/photolyase family protein n=1 Tax=Meiothermus sp. TaxID=1955249 RepID=UPI0025FFE7F5|nr:deoxyribodipyrimidine photo-lyase [Meiothermus sp.]MCS7067043.1 DNA photolyase family protein [Meiothermus sp.]MDW8424546.1 deoxyribodipyrimidine photo-lyase [Meiothermus sp.]